MHVSVFPPTCMHTCHLKGKFESLSCWLAVGANALDTASSHSPPDWSMSLCLVLLLPFVSPYSLCLFQLHLTCSTNLLRSRKNKENNFFLFWARNVSLLFRCRFKWDYSFAANCSFIFLPPGPHTHRRAGANRLPALSCQPPTNCLLCHCHLTSPSAVCDDVNNYTQLALH